MQAMQGVEQTFTTQTTQAAPSRKRGRGEETATERQIKRACARADEEQKAPTAVTVHADGQPRTFEELPQDQKNAFVFLAYFLKCMLDSFSAMAQRVRQQSNQ